MGDEAGPTEDEFEEEADDGMPFWTQIYSLKCLSYSRLSYFGHVENYLSIGRNLKNLPHCVTKAVFRSFPIAWCIRDTILRETAAL